MPWGAPVLVSAAWRGWSWKKGLGRSVWGWGGGERGRKKSPEQRGWGLLASVWCHRLVLRWHNAVPQRGRAGHGEHFPISSCSWAAVPSWGVPWFASGETEAKDQLRGECVQCSGLVHLHRMLRRRLLLALSVLVCPPLCCVARLLPEIPRRNFPRPRGNNSLPTSALALLRFGLLEPIGGCALRFPARAGLWFGVAAARARPRAAREGRRKVTEPPRTAVIRVFKNRRSS